MKEVIILRQIKQLVHRIIPSQDGRTEVNPLAFVMHLIFSFQSDSKRTSLESIRRQMKARLNQDISRSAFWERLSRKRLKVFLQQTVLALISQLSQMMLGESKILQILEVTAIQLVDSSSFTLWDGSQEDFPGTRTHAGIKWHACFDLLKGVLVWFEFTPTSVHDRRCFPQGSLLKGKLTLFDLGYWDYSLLLSIEQVGGYFLSRVKANAVLPITKVVYGLSPKYQGKPFSQIQFKRKRKQVLEFITEKSHQGQVLRYRVLGFWNPRERIYHWYITNLKVPAQTLYPLYRLRWQVELIFKGAKQSLHADRMTTNCSNIIESLLLASLAAQLVSVIVLKISQQQLDENQRFAVSFQRLAKVMTLLSQEFIDFFLKDRNQALEALLQKMILLANEIYDPNYQHRETSLMRLKRLLEQETQSVKTKQPITQNLEKRKNAA